MQDESTIRIFETQVADRDLAAGYISFLFWISCEVVDQDASVGVGCLYLGNGAEKVGDACVPQWSVEQICTHTGMGSDALEGVCIKLKS